MTENNDVPQDDPELHLNGQQIDEEDEYEDEDDDSKPLVFHATRKTKPVIVYEPSQDPIQRAEGVEVPLKCVLKDMMSPAIDRWLKYRSMRIKLDKKGRPKPESADFRDYCATLITECLFFDDGAGCNTNVPLSRIRLWNAMTIQGLYDICETRNGLNGEGQDNAKKAMRTTRSSKSGTGSPPPPTGL